MRSLAAWASWPAGHVRPRSRVPRARALRAPRLRARARPPGLRPCRPWPGLLAEAGRPGPHRARARTSGRRATGPVVRPSRRPPRLRPASAGSGGGRLAGSPRDSARPPRACASRTGRRAPGRGRSLPRVARRTRTPRRRPAARARRPRRWREVGRRLGQLPARPRPRGSHAGGRSPSAGRGGAPPAALDRVFEPGCDLPARRGGRGAPCAGPARRWDWPGPSSPWPGVRPGPRRAAGPRRRSGLRLPAAVGAYPLLHEGVSTRGSGGSARACRRRGSGTPCTRGGRRRRPRPPRCRGSGRPGAPPRPARARCEASRGARGRDWGFASKARSRSPAASSRRPCGAQVCGRGPGARASRAGPAG